MYKKSSNLEKPTLENYNAMDDFLFFKYMGEEGNEKQQKGLSEALGISITGKIKSINPKVPPDNKEGKTSILDCYIETENAKIDIEAQRQEVEDFMEKIIAYVIKMLITSLKKGKNYSIMKKAIAIIICDFNFLKSPLYHNIIDLRNRDIKINEQLTDKIELHFIEMPKVRKLPMYKIIKKYLKSKNNKINITITKEFQYLLFMDSEITHSERKEIVKMGDEGLKDAIEKIELAFQDNEALDAYLTQKIEEISLENRLNIREKRGEERGEKRGEERGEQNGIKKGIKETAKRLKNMGLSIEEIAKATDLTPEMIEKL